MPAKFLSGRSVTSIYNSQPKEKLFLKKTKYVRKINKTAHFILRGVYNEIPYRSQIAQIVNRYKQLAI